MSKQEIGSLACKILGIYMISQGLNAMANLISLYIFNPQQPSINNLTSMVFPFVFLIILGFLLWFLSDKLGAIMLKGESSFHEYSGLKARDIQRVAFSVVGLLLFGNSIPKFVSAAVYLHSLREIPNATVRISSLQGAAGAITQFIIGLGIFLGSQGLVNLLHIIRTAGVSKKEDFSEE